MKERKEKKRKDDGILQKCKSVAVEKGRTLHVSP
jgi:hypothetical protein